MGKGDQRTRRGKLVNGSFGKRRPKHKQKPTPVVATPTKKKAAKH